jgi:DNA-binding SARP family transcriptional activator
LAPDRLRIYLTGKVCLEYGHRSADERQLPARQGRLAFAYLVCERFRPVTRDELGDAIWPDALPPAWETALSALVSKLRHLLQRLELPAAAASITSRSGRYQLQLPPTPGSTLKPPYRRWTRRKGVCAPGPSSAPGGQPMWR